VTYAFTDGLGSVQATKTASGGTTRPYESFGKPLTAPPGPCVNLRSGVAGEQHDAETGFSYLRALPGPGDGAVREQGPGAGLWGDPLSQQGYV